MNGNLVVGAAIILIVAAAAICLFRQKRKGIGCCGCKGCGCCGRNPQDLDAQCGCRNDKN